MHQAYLMANTFESCLLQEDDTSWAILFHSGSCTHFACPFSVLCCFQVQWRLLTYCLILRYSTCHWVLCLQGGLRRHFARAVAVSCDTEQHSLSLERKTDHMPSAEIGFACCQSFAAVEMLCGMVVWNRKSSNYRGRVRVGSSNSLVALLDTYISRWKPVCVATLSDLWFLAKPTEYSMLHSLQRQQRCCFHGFSSIEVCKNRSHIHSNCLLRPDMHTLSLYCCEQF